MCNRAAPTRAALLDGTLTLVIAHQIDRLAADTLSAMRAAVDNGQGFGAVNLIPPFELYTSENL